MSSPAFEAFLARLYVEPALRESFLADPVAEAARAGLPHDDCAALARIDRAGLLLAAESFRRKRQKRIEGKRVSNAAPSLWARTLRRIRSWRRRG